MAKFYGKIGFASTVETVPGVHVEQITERSYKGDVIRNTRRLEGADQVNSDINVSNSISIVSDPYADGNFFAMRYLHWMGVRWKVTSVEVRRPRLILTIGGVYNGPTP